MRGVLEPQGWQSTDLTLSDPVASPDGSTVWSATGTVPAAAVTTSGFDYWLEVVEGDQVGTFPLGATETSTAPTYVHTTVPTQPVIRHLPPSFGRDGEDLVVEAEATCATGACEAVLYYRSTDGPIIDESLDGRQDWPSVQMDATVAGSLGDAGVAMMLAVLSSASKINPQILRQPALWQPG